MKYKTQKGFTLMELLVVILVIGILGGILFRVINPQGIQRKSRDSQREADLRQLQSVLELYFNNNREYPDSLGDLVPTYLNVLPTDPSTGSQYTYDTTLAPDPDNSTYVLYSYMEMESTAEKSACPTGMMSDLSVPAAQQPYCYLLSSPTCQYAPIQN